MTRADEILEGLASAGYDATNGGDRLALSAAGGGGFTGAIARKQVSPEGQKYHQAAMDWVRAKLRKESGAAIGKDEADKEYETYFPVYGDTAGVIEQKRQARAEANRAMRQSAGGAMAPASASPKPQQKRLKYNPATGRLE